jgi:mono/diheme cytochrome c family protein
MNDDAKNLSAVAGSSGDTSLPLWMTGLLGVLLYAGCMYLDAHSGGYNPLVHAPYHSTNELNSVKPGGEDPAIVLGRMKYQQVCMPCHQENGLGVPNQFPPLAGSEWVLAPGSGRLIRMVQNGVTGPLKVKGVDWNLTMPPMGATMDDKELAAVLTFIRVSWGNNASKITPEQVKVVRGAMAGRTDPFTVDEILKISETD